MKRLPKSTYIAFKPVKLYLDDIEKIHDALSQASNDITIETDEYEVEDVKELIDLKQEVINYLRFKLSNPYITVELKPSSAELYIAQDDPISVDIFYKIKRILLGRQRGRVWHFFNYWGANLLFGLSIGYITYALQKGSLTHGLISALLFVLIVGIIAQIWRSRFRHYSVIFLKFRKDFPSFWKRNNDNIIINIVVAIISAVLSGIVTYIMTTQLGVKP